MPKSKLSAQSVLAFLNQQQRASQPETSEIEELRDAYRKAAAVLACIVKPEQLNPVGLRGKTGEAQDLLKQELIPATGRKFDGAWMLAPQARRGALRELGSRSRIETALKANPNERTGPIQERLESYLLGNGKPIQEQSLEDLEETLQVTLWLQGTLDGVPSPDEVRSRLEYFQLLAPFESLSGDSVFRGRTNELDQLRTYVGVKAPETLLARIADAALRWTRSSQQPALCVYGPGGVGKSALVARFMLEHTRMPDEARIPFAYLDFDRPTLDISDPLTLCNEMMRQLSLQFPKQSKFKMLHTSLAEFMAKDDAIPDEVSIGGQQSSIRNAFQDLFRELEQELGPRPYIVVLDTFEEVQYRGETRAFPFWDVLKDIQGQWPFLRVITSGRAPVTSLRLAGKEPLVLELGALDKAAAVAFLKAKGVSDSTLAERLVDQVGGMPLSLKLAASLVTKEGSDRRGIKQLGNKSKFWSSTSDEVIQVQLYDRILGHIHDVRVERLAHPGLVLRRITPEVIFNVLNEPCGLALATMEDAEVLFDELRKETALVTVDDSEGALVHRADLRRLMLGLLEQKSPAQVEQIRRAAVEWYSKQEGRRARAEELYHRLQLGQRIEKSAVMDPEIKASLQISLTELPIEAQLLLASYGFQVSKEVLERATREQTEAHEVARIEELLSYGKSSIEEANSILKKLMPRIDRASSLFQSAARVASQRGNKTEALNWIEKGMAYSIASNNTLQTLDLVSEKAWTLRGSKNTNDLPNTLRILNEYSARHYRRSAIVQHRIQTYELQSTTQILDTYNALNEIGRMIAELDPLQLWGMVLALDSVIEPVTELRADLPQRMRSIIFHDNSPFRGASFSDRKARAAFDGFMASAQEYWGEGSVDVKKDFIQPFRNLCRAWPYRVLHVQPPYGSRSDELSEAPA